MFSLDLPGIAAVVFGMAWGLLASAALLAALRLWHGPSTADRLVALELLASIVVGSALLAAADSGIVYSLDLALVLALVGFMGSASIAGIIFHKEAYDE